MKKTTQSIVLEYLNSNPGEPQSISEIAAATGIKVWNVAGVINTLSRQKDGKIPTVTKIARAAYCLTSHKNEAEATLENRKIVPIDLPVPHGSDPLMRAIKQRINPENFFQTQFPEAKSAIDSYRSAVEGRILERSPFIEKYLARLQQAIRIAVPSAIKKPQPLAIP
jgi:hypothetical protein